MCSAKADHLLEDVIKAAKQAGADAADAVLFSATMIAASQRLGRPEGLERAESDDLGLRVFVGRKQACVSTTDLSARSRTRLAEMAVAMARAVPEDPHCGLPEPGAYTDQWPDLDLEDPGEPATETLIEMAREAEDAARAVNGVTNSNGAEADWSRNTVNLMTSNGFSGSYSKTMHAVSASVVAGQGADMQRDSDFTSALHGEDMAAPADVGKSAAERTVSRLNPRKVGTCKAPVIFDPRVSRTLLGHLTGAVRGTSIARGASMLKGRMGEQIMSAGISVIDDPLRVRGLRSKPFDAEGLAPQRYAVVEDGVLKNWILDTATSRKLGMVSNGHASRGTSSPPSPRATNLYMEAGALPPEDLIAGVENGLYVTEMMGSSVSILSGDYSRGAGGFWIENGQIAYPVSELTIAGNLADMWMNITPANDLVFRYGVNAPTVLVEGLTVAGG